MRLKGSYSSANINSDPITKTRLFKFHLEKIKKFSDKKKLWYFYISAQNIDCGYS